MTDSTKKILGTLVSVLLAGTAAVFHNNPSVSASLLGALHIQRPGDVKLTDIPVAKS